jgi:peptidoglycan/LPS O-acetylase OafA/YrhL
MTLGEKLDQHRGVGQGFDFLRVFLAISIVAAHSYWVIDYHSTLGIARLTWLPVNALVPMFFALSGFLIAGSAQRLRLREFMINRGLRIIPALAVEIIGSAFILGAVFTSLPLSQYYSSATTWHYLTNIIGLINYWLPGVFGPFGDPGAAVNTSLWTIPVELSCYAIMAVFIVVAMINRPILIVIAALSYGAISIAAQVAMHHVPQTSIAGTVLVDLFVGEAPPLPLFFMVGIVFYLYRHRIAYHWAALASAFVFCLVVAAFAPEKWIYTPIVSVLTCIPIVYIVAYAGVSDIPKLPFYHRGDYSYGIYLYGYPIQQALKHTFSGITSPWQLTLVAVPVITLFAAFSWHFIEKPILKVRKKFSFIAKTRLEEGSQYQPAVNSPMPAEMAHNSGHAGFLQRPADGAQRMGRQAS